MSAGFAGLAIVAGCVFGGGSETRPVGGDNTVSATGEADDGPGHPSSDGGGGEGIPNPNASDSTSSGGETGEETSATQGTETGGGCESAGRPGCPCETEMDCVAGALCVDEVCEAPLCGNGRIDRDEECDDGNGNDDDGCETTCRTSPGVAQVVTGAEHTCARTHDGEVKCWGRGDDGRLGYGNTEMIGNTDTPADVGYVDVGGPVFDLCAGLEFTCAAFGDGDVRCWGNGGTGKLGNLSGDNVGDDEVPSAVDKIEIGGTVVAIACGERHACALLEDDGAIRCWGRNDNGRLGSLVSEPIGDDEHPSSIDPVEVGGAAVDVVAGTAHTCALLRGGEVRCWGAAGSGRLGNGTTTPDIGDDEPPSVANNVIELPPVVQLTAGGDHTCALTDEPAVRCWGDNVRGQLGSGDTDFVGGGEPLDTLAPVALSGTPVAVAAGVEHTCAILQTGEVRCWGHGQHGRLGYESQDDLQAPSMDAVDLGAGVAALGLTLGGSHTCARVDGGELVCFGRNNRGQLGYGGTDSVGDDETPGSVGFVPFF